MARTKLNPAEVTLQHLNDALALLHRLTGWVNERRDAILMSDATAPTWQDAGDAERRALALLEMASWPLLTADGSEQEAREIALKAARAGAITAGLLPPEAFTAAPSAALTACKVWDAATGRAMTIPVDEDRRAAVADASRTIETRSRLQTLFGRYIDHLTMRHGVKPEELRTEGAIADALTQFETEAVCDTCTDLLDADVWRLKPATKDRIAEGIRRFQK